MLREKAPKCAEFLHGDRPCGCGRRRTGGRWSNEAMQFIAELAACHDREAPQVVRFSNVLFDLITLQTDQFLVADSAPGALMLVRRAKRDAGVALHVSSSPYQPCHNRRVSESASSLPLTVGGLGLQSVPISLLPVLFCVEDQCCCQQCCQRH